MERKANGKGNGRKTRKKGGDTHNEKEIEGRRKDEKGRK